MCRDESFPIVFDEGQQVGALLRRQIDFTHAKEEDRVEVVQIANVELFTGGDTGAGGKHNGTLRDQLRVGANERLVVARFTPQALHRRERVRDGVVLIAITNIRPRQDSFARLLRVRKS
jgi:hypothetical protein